jgi:hypothetical protein
MVTERVRQITSFVVTLAVIAVGVRVYGPYATRWHAASPRPEAVKALLPSPEIRQDVTLTFPAHEIVVRFACANDDSEALHRLAMLRALSGSEDMQAMVAIHETASSPKYAIIALLSNDAVVATREAHKLLSTGSDAMKSSWVVVTRAQVDSWKEQTRVLRALYRTVANPDAGHSPASLAVLRDIHAVAKHYSIPFRLFAEVGGRDHDYMDSQGLIEDAQWRDVPRLDELVIARMPGRILAIPKSVDSWKLTEQAIQYAHLMCIRDGLKALEGLPAHLQPPREPTDDLPIGTVITYGGRLLRDLLDLCHGSPECAVAALVTDSADVAVRFDVGVRRTALYARRTLNHIGAISRSMIRQKYVPRR